MANGSGRVPAHSAEPSKPPHPGDAPYESSKKCGACHDVMFKAWSDSQHARSASSPAYLEALKRVVDQAQDKKAARESCVWCHAPTTILTGDLELQLPISREPMDHAPTSGLCVVATSRERAVK